MKQEIYPDPHGFDTWDPENYGRLFVHIVNSEMFREITGMAPPPTLGPSGLIFDTWGAG